MARWSDGVRTSPLAAAAGGGRVELVALLIEAGARLGAGDTLPLVQAAAWGSEEVLTLLLSCSYSCSGGGPPAGCRCRGRSQGRERQECSQCEQEQGDREEAPGGRGHAVSGH